MATAAHLAELKKGVESWNRWRVRHPSCVPDLSEADLRGTNLYLANLCRANLNATHLGGAYLFKAVLELANLNGAVLELANLNGANLNGANLAQAYLAQAYLAQAYLAQAYLAQAYLKGAILDGAILKGAILDGANLNGANLNGANLNGTNLNGANCGATIWGELNLLEVIGLSTLDHRSQSTLATNTLVLSKGRLPVEFLKGCGLADWEIESAKLYDPLLPASEVADIVTRVHELVTRGPIQISPLFISYSHGDTAFVDRLGSMLDSKGVRFWRDIKDATAGRLDKVIERGISLNPTLLLVLSERAIESDWVEYEVDRAVQLSKKLKRDVLCPIALDKAWLESDRMSGNLRNQIKKYNVLDFGAHNDATVFETQFRKLIDGLALHYRDRTGPATDAWSTSGQC